MAQIYRYDNDDDDDDGKDKLIIDFSKHTLIRLAEIFDQDDDYWSLQPPDASNPTGDAHILGLGCLLHFVGRPERTVLS